MKSLNIVMICMFSGFILGSGLAWICLRLIKFHKPKSERCYYVFYNKGGRFAKNSWAEAKKEASKLMKTNMDLSLIHI